MSYLSTKLSLSNFLQSTLCLLVFLLPWQTILITKEQFLNGSKWEYGTLGFYATEGLLWFAVILFIITLGQKVKEKKAAGTFSFSWTQDRKFILACALFIAYIFCSTLWSIDRAVAWQHAIWIMEAFLLFFMLTIFLSSRANPAAAGEAEGSGNAKPDSSISLPSVASAVAGEWPR